MRTNLCPKNSSFDCYLASKSTKSTLLNLYHVSEKDNYTAALYKVVT